ncbi:Common central domain of tyrosinase [Trichostrongylus colubriformis]|uniref:Common central domain of tyrosinase n=1 Tax=Trichostrongylus colubriformis TaxID=6319 RepID=A0AAN8FW16_TRICO
MVSSLAPFLVSALFVLGSTYKRFHFVTLNGKVYRETIEQPWFRVPHLPHNPIELASVNESNFGKHLLPDDDVYVAHNWTEEEKKYLPCLNLTCVCPFYRGKVSGSKCVLPNGKLLQKALRKEVRMLTDTERLQIATAFNGMKASGIYDRYGAVHKYNGLHEGPGFFTWHREYLKRFELVFRQFLPPGSRLGLPYWDSSLESELPDPHESVFFSPLFVGAADKTGHIIDGPYASWLTMEKKRKLLRRVPKDEEGEVLNNARIDFVLELKSVNHVMAAVMPLETCKIIVRDDRLLSFSHDYVHYFIGGDMYSTHSSTNDPIFYFHHTMIDQIWELWRLKQQTREQREKDYPPPLADCYPQTHFANVSLKGLEPYTNQDVLSNSYTDNMYEYERRPTCSLMKPDCGSKFLFCHPVDGYLQCITKLHAGATCDGFEKTPICYEGECVAGRCVKNKSYLKRENPQTEWYM